MSMSWRAPYRPDNEITQSYNDGVVAIHKTEDTARAGYQPVITLVEPAAWRLRYAELRLGLQRYYEARQNQVEVERVIRVPRVTGITNQDVAVTEDGRKYRIDMVQSADDVYPPSLDLTLAKISQGVSGSDGME